MVNESKRRSENSAEIISNLGKDSATLHALASDFGKVIAQLPVLTTYEIKETPTLAKKEDGTWDRIGPPVWMVQRESAVLNSKFEELHPCDRDHSKIAKLDRFPSGTYQVVTGFIKRSLKPRNQDFPNVQAGSPMALGLQFQLATPIDEEAFIGREDELQTLKNCLLPPKRTTPRKVVVLSGLGGVGKTQLALQFSIKYQGEFSSVILLDASNKTRLTQSFIKLAQVIAELSDRADSDVSAEGEEGAVLQARRWLSETHRPGWLLILDNYDDPSVLGYSSNTGYDIREMYPLRMQGSIIVISRTRVKLGEVMRLTKLQNKDGLRVLLKQSEREGISDGNKSLILNGNN